MRVSEACRPAFSRPIKRHWFKRYPLELDMRCQELRQAIRTYHECMREQVLSMAQVTDSKGYGAVRVRLRDETGQPAYAIDYVDVHGEITEMWGGPIEYMEIGVREYQDRWEGMDEQVD